MTKKITLSVLAALALLIPARVHAARAAAPQDNFSFEMPKDINAQPDLHRVWSKASNFAIGGVGTTCNLIYTGKGIVAGVSGWGENAGDMIALFDASAVGSLSAATPDTSKLIAIVDIDTAKVNPDVEPMTGFPFLSGLVACPKSSGAYAAIRYFKQL